MKGKMANTNFILEDKTFYFQKTIVILFYPFLDKITGFKTIAFGAAHTNVAL